MSNTIISTFENTINEFCEVATWLNSQLLDSKNLTATNYKIISNRIDALQPTAEKYETSFRDGNINVDETILIRFENLYSTLWNTITLLLKNNYDNDFVLKSLVNNIKHDKDSISEIEEKIFDVTKAHIDLFTNIITTKNDSNLQNSLVEAHICLFQSYIQRNDTETARIYLEKVQMDNLPNPIIPKTILEISRTIYNSSLHVYKKSINKTSEVLNDIATYLEKSLQFITRFVNDIKTHIDYVPLKYSLLSLLVQCIIENPSFSSDNKERAMTLLEQLQMEYPKKAIPFQLHVKFLKIAKSEDMTDMIASTIMQMILNVDIPKNIDSLLNTINEISEISTKHALNSLDYLFRNKIDQIKDQVIFERVIVTRFYMTLQSKNLSETEMIESLCEFYKLMEQNISKPLSRTSVSSLVTLLWSSGKKIEKTESYVLCSKFYELSLNDLISESYADLGKLQRALVNSYILSNELTKADDLLNSMSSQEKIYPLTILLQVKLQLALQNITQIPKLFQLFSQSSTERSIESFILSLNEVRNYPELLISGVTSLFKMLNKMNESIGKLEKGKWDLSIVSLVRFTVQSVLKLGEETQQNLNLNVRKIISLLDVPQKYFKDLKSKRVLNILEDGTTSNETTFKLTVDDIEWFASTAYNVGSALLQDETQLEASLECVSLANRYVELIPYADFTFTKMYYFNYWGYRCRAQTILIKYHILDVQQGRDIENFSKLQNSEPEMLIQDIIAFIQIATPNKLISTDQIDELEILIIEACQVYLNLLLDESKIDAINNIFSIELCQNQIELDTSLAQCLINRDGIPMNMRRPFLIKLISRSLNKDYYSITTICYWIRIVFTDYNNKISSMEHDIFECTLTKVKENKNTSCNRSLEEELDIENISSICWNFGITCLISEERDEFIKWAKLAYRFSKYARIGLEQQMRNLWNSLLSTGQVPNTDQIANIFVD
ncbi:hypothetical protein C6P45_001330 [Maudiozyma exigua]|uniref:Protein ZIP4 homolog n=1 Tax=Maudiozyma exigua TaxID=34358 RepID=A0A9P6WD97_MAUEX|nr:hypothetical protein C6P45_001330 [Kazachstania exigua]